MDLGAAAATDVASTLGVSLATHGSRHSVAVLGVRGPSAAQISVMLAPNVASTWQWHGLHDVDGSFVFIN